jgi:GDP-mannose 6-dehydrogenase
MPIHLRLQEILQQASGRKLGESIGYGHHPEFLREGNAVADFCSPRKIVFGATEAKTREVCKKLYPDLKAPTFFVSCDVASMIKYADNCFHAVKVTFANEIGSMCNCYGLDAHAVMDVLCQDTLLNISAKYLRPGAPFGGPCLPNDVRALLDLARDTGNSLPMISGVLESNAVQFERLVRRIVSPQNSAVGIVGLTFKEETGDVRGSITISLVEQLRSKGHPVRIFDAHIAAEDLTEANLALIGIAKPGELLTKDLQSLVNGADILVVSHRLKPEVWAKVRFRARQRIIDLVNVQELKVHPGYEGLYW